MGIFEKKPEKETPEQQRRTEVEDLMHKYKQQIRDNLKTVGAEEISVQEVKSKVYNDFKQQYLAKHLTIYEKACNISEKILKVHPDPKLLPEYEESIRICHLNTTPSGVFSLSLLFPLILTLFGALISYALFNDLFFVAFFVLVGFALVLPFQKMPMYLANSWRMKASNQMVLCIFYVVTYMRHTSNLENAIGFASEYLEPPLSLDLKRILWDVETEKFSTVQESIDSYLETWKKWNMEFLESFHLIESSLYETDNNRRVELLDKSLSVILDETYEKMLHYAQNLKSPMTMLHMLGVILPILGLVILPLIVSFMSGVKWYYLFVLYNITVPIIVFYFGKNILSTRPSGYGGTEVGKDNPELQRLEKKVSLGLFKVDKAYLGFALGVILIIIGLLPVVLFAINVDTEQAEVNETSWDILMLKNVDESETGSVFVKIDTLRDNREGYYLLGYIKSKGCEDPEKFGECEVLGPFGLFSSILSIFIIMGIGLGFGLYYKYRSENVMTVREKAKALESEFSSALFQLGNRLGDGIPAEIAFSRVAETMEGTESGNFFRLVSSNISRLGMSVEQAIFDPQVGALVYYPSKVIRSSMSVLSESVRKGPMIASQALLNVSRYIKEIHRVDERLKDLMAEIISSMKSQIKFMAPVISGIVIGITSMITAILGKLSGQFGAIKEAAGEEGKASLLTLFGDGLPTYYFQFVVGIYVVEIIWILTILANGIENGSDKPNERFELGNNLLKSVAMYCTIAFALILAFNLLAEVIISRTA